MGPSLTCRPRPRGRSGCVMTPTTVCDECTRRSSVGTANPGVPKKATRSDISPSTRFARSGRGSPFAGFLELLDLADDEISRDAPQPIDEQALVEVIHFVLQRASEQVRAGKRVLLTVTIQTLHDDSLWPRDGGGKARQAETPFFFELHALALDELRIDHDVQGRGI